MKVALALVAVLTIGCRRHPLPGETEPGDGGGGIGGAVASGTGGIAGGGAAGTGAIGGAASGGLGGAVNEGAGGSATGGIGGAATGGVGGSANGGVGGSANGGIGGSATGGIGGSANGGRGGAGGGAGAGGAGGGIGGALGGAGAGGRKPPGTPCTSSVDCTSGLCVDGVCCSSPCNGACVSCNRLGMAGVCLPVAVNAPDPHGSCLPSPPGSCGMDGRCDGAGACELAYPRGTVCGAETCSGAVYTPPGVCDGAGSCVLPVSLICSPYKCNAGGTRCETGCLDDTGCSAGRCVNHMCQVGGGGPPCTSNDVCASGFCVQGICCATACATPCNSCGLAGSIGVCTPVPNPDPSWSCPNRS